MKENTYNLLLGNCCQLIKNIPDKSVDAIITDPPYLYLAPDKRMPHIDFDIPWNEDVFFSEAMRVLKPKGFLVYFGRGTAFYRWNTIADKSGFAFKEEIVWNKGKSSSPFSRFSHIHELAVIMAKRKSTSLNSCRIPYNDMYDIKNNISIEDSILKLNKIINDIKKILNDLKKDNAKKTLIKYLETNIDKNVNDIKINNKLYTGKYHRSKSPSIMQKLYSAPYAIYTLNSIFKGVKERSIIDVPVSSTSVWKVSNVKNTWHPTEKPVRLMERLIALTTKEGDVVLDPFMGSGSTGVACKNLNRSFIGMDINRNYYNIARLRIEKNVAKPNYKNTTGRDGLKDYLNFIEELKERIETINEEDNQKKEEKEVATLF